MAADRSLVERDLVVHVERERPIAVRLGAEAVRDADHPVAADRITDGQKRFDDDAVGEGLDVRVRGAAGTRELCPDGRHGAEGERDGGAAADNSGEHPPRPGLRGFEHEQSSSRHARGVRWERAGDLPGL